MLNASSSTATSSFPTLDRRVFGTFVEHMGRCVYGGIYEPGHPDRRRARLPRRRAGADAGSSAPPSCAIPAAISCPATTGRTASGRRTSARRGSTSPGSRPRPTSSAPTNSSTGAARPASSRCSASISARAGPTRRATSSNTATIPAAPTLSDLRRAHGYEKPHDIKFWCLGNEMDGPWQICAQDRRGIRPRRAGDRQGHALGRSRRSSSPPAARPTATCRPTAPGNTRCSTIASTQVDFISLHTYFQQPRTIDSRGFLGNIELARLLHQGSRGDRRRGRRRRARSPKRIMLSLDEWNVWYKARTLGRPAQARLAEGAAADRGGLQLSRTRWSSAAR